MTTINIEQLNTITENLKIQDAVRPLTTAEITKHWEVYSNDLKSKEIEAVLNEFKKQLFINTNEVQIEDILEKLTRRNERYKTAQESAKKLKIPSHWIEDSTEKHIHEEMSLNTYLLSAVDKLLKTVDMETAVAFLLSFSPKLGHQFLVSIVEGNSKS